MRVSFWATPAVVVEVRVIGGGAIGLPKELEVGGDTPLPLDVLPL
jgi:hypothetical protein